MKLNEKLKLKFINKKFFCPSPPNKIYHQSIFTFNSLKVLKVVLLFFFLYNFQRLFVEMEQMASRPFAGVAVELDAQLLVISNQSENSEQRKKVDSYISSFNILKMKNIFLK